MIWTIAFWKGAGERALKTFVQTFIASLVAAVGTTLSAWDVPWLTSLYAAGGIGLMAAFLSLCTSLGNAEFTAGTTAVEPAERAEV